jgi:hypothetical protein
MTLFIQNDAVGAGAGTISAALAAVHLTVIANLDTGFGLGATTGNLQAVTYTQTDPGIPPTRLNTLVNTAFNVNPAGIDIILLAVGGNFTLNDGSLITTSGGTALSPAGSGLPGSTLNGTASALVIYDTSDNNGSGYCIARQGTGGTLDLRIPLSVMAYHELSHAFRIVTTGLLALTAQCNPSSPEENAAITDENDMRTQLATLVGDPVVLRDPLIHCGQSCGGGGGSCCIVATVSSGSPLSAEVAELRALRDGFLRRSEVGFAFFESLHYAYYGFSPQVVTIMAADLGLRSMALHGFVRPLIRMLRLCRAYAVDGVDTAELGRRVAAELGDRADVLAAQAVLSRMVALTDDPARAELSLAERRVADLLAGRALPDPHVSWALIEPVRMYHSLLGSVRGGATPDALGRELQEFLVDWAGRLPIDTCWGRLDVNTVRAELDMLASTLLRSPRARDVFLRRLAERYAAATAVATAVGERLEGVSV